MKPYWLNVKGEVIHEEATCGESCNRDDTDEVREADFREAAEHLTLRGYKLCERMEPSPKALGMQAKED